MSLLMDALRKAEESKKQAEQEQQETDISGGNEVELSADSDAVEFDLDAPELTPDASPTNLDVLVEFEEDQVEDTKDSLLTNSVEPEITELEVVRAQPTLEDSIEPELVVDDSLSPSLEPFAEAINSASKALETKQKKPRSEPIEPDVREIQADSDQLESEMGSAIKQSTEPATPVPQSTKASFADTQRLASKPENLIHQEPQQISGEATSAVSETPSISKKTEKSRKSARSVFAAKKLKLQNQRPLLIAVSGLAAVLVMGAGFYFILNSGSSTDFNIPQTAMSDSANGSIIRDEPPVEVNELENGLPQPAVGQTSIEQNISPATGTATLSNAIVEEASSDSDLLDGAVQVQVSQNVPEEESALSVEDLATIAMNELIVSPLTETSATVASIDTLNATTTAALLSAADSNSAVAPANQSNSIAAEQSSPSGETTSELGIAAERIDSGADSNGLPPVDSSSESSLIAFKKTEITHTVSPLLSEAYQSYQNGMLNNSARLYREVLEESPQDIDALMGLAAIASMQSQPSIAMGYYSQILALDPSQAVARSNLLALMPNGSTTEQERALKRLNEDNPNVPALVFTLANFYAGQSRWSDAQQNYYKALQLAKNASLTGNPVSPDYAFNLAVSLEQLNQPTAAVPFYEEALQLAKEHPANFNQSIAEQRLLSLAEARN